MVAVALAALAWSGASQALPRFDDVKASYRPSDVTVVDRHGVALQTVRIDKTVRRLPWLRLDEVSPALLQAIVLSEDRRFYEHSGVDWSAVAQSAWGNLWNTRTRGASTLTMQLAGLLDDDLARPAGGRSMGQKIGQALTATQLDARWKKTEILEAYLNEVAWRGEIVGINALSQTLFGKHASGLDSQEAAIAAALLRGPNADAAVVAQRACGVLRLQQLGCVGVTALTETALVRRGGMPLGEQLAPHFARVAVSQVMANARASAFGQDRAMADAGSLDTPLPLAPRDGRQAARSETTPTVVPPIVATTLDARLQRIAIAALRRQMAELSGRNVEDGAVLVLDNASGEVLAWVGSSGSYSDAAQVDGVTSRRQPGSTLKPFVYELAFERRLITPASLIEDSPAQLATTSGLYLPQNYDRHFKGWVSARTALASSLNVPAVRVGAMLGPDALFSRLNDYGFALPESGGYYGYSLALGSADVTLAQLTNAYRMLANGGRFSPLITSSEPSRRSAQVELGSKAWGAGGEAARDYRGPRSSSSRLAVDPEATRQVADAAAVHLVTDILSDNQARVPTFGLDSSLATRGFAAVKTGTSKDMRDNWCVGFTDRYTVGVWVGNASGAPMHEVSGVSGAAPVWQAVTAYLHAGQVSRPPRPVAGVVAAPVRFEGAATEPARDEVFLAGTEQAVFRSGAQMAAGRVFGIRSPRDGSIFAVDPDMPPAAQRIRFEGAAGTWTLDGKHIARSSGVWWSPWPGRHELRWTALDGVTTQTVRFEVRGAAVKTAGR
ncbi:MAG: penicillin-binding protein [Rhizobacter sp.]|nr:penicillin-binding protein [Rhizobacter sp.]